MKFIWLKNLYAIINYIESSEHLQNIIFNEYLGASAISGWYEIVSRQIKIVIDSMFDDLSSYEIDEYDKNIDRLCKSAWDVLDSFKKD